MRPPPALPAAHFERNDITTICETVHWAEIIQKPEANHGLPAQHILRAHRGLRAMLLSDFVAASSYILGHKADPAANQPSGVEPARFAVRAREERDANMPNVERYDLRS